MDAAVVLEQIDDLLAIHSRMLSRSKYDDLSDLKVESAALVVRLQAAIDRLAPASTTYAKEARSHADEPPHVRIRPLVGILVAMRADIAAGWLQEVGELLHAETFADFLEQARELKEKGYKDAAAVVAGSVLEVHVRLLCARKPSLRRRPRVRPRRPTL